MHLYMSDTLLDTDMWKQNDKSEVTQFVIFFQEAPWGISNYYENFSAQIIHNPQKIKPGMVVFFFF